MYINRTWTRTEEDDFKLNVEDHLKRDNLKEALPVTHEGIVVGWRIQNRYE